MPLTFARQHVSDVAEIVNPEDVAPRAGESVVTVSISFSDGSQVEVSERGRELVEFILAALNSGREVHVDAEEALLTPVAAAQVLGVTRQSVYRWQDAGLLPVVMKGRSRSVPAAAVRELKMTRDSRALLDVASSLAADAGNLDAADASTSGGRHQGQGSRGGVDAEDLYAAAQEALRFGQTMHAGRLWRTARAAQVARNAQHTRDHS
jgi:excisionase family DNA binding protein